MRAKAGSSFAQSCGIVISIIREKSGAEAPDARNVSVGASPTGHRQNAQACL